MSALIVFGAGGHGRVVADAARASGKWSSIAFFDDRWPAVAEFAGCPVLGDLQALVRRIEAGGPEIGKVIVAVGDNRRRLDLCHTLMRSGADLATVIHPFTAVSPESRIGAGSVVLAGAVVGPGASLGIACIANTRSSIDHDCVLGDAVHVCPGVSLAGSVSVGEATLIGVGSSVIPEIRIGSGAIVGAGTVVIRDVAAGATVVGSPGREVKRAR